MAKKSVISRPYGTKWILKYGNESSWYPQDTTEENLHLLLSESVADDDATYVCLKALYMLGLCCNIPTKENLVGVKLHYRARSDGTILTANAHLRIYLKDNADEYVSSDNVQIPGGNNTWTTYNGDCSTDDFLQAVKSTNYEDYVFAVISCGESEGDNSKGVNTQPDTYYTQVYVEFIYEVKETPFYFRENGAWTALEDTIYQKIDGVWIESTSDVLNEGSSYKIITI